MWSVEAVMVDDVVALSGKPTSMMTTANCKPVKQITHPRVMARGHRRAAGNTTVPMKSQPSKAVWEWPCSHGRKRTKGISTM